ncbi:MAG: phytoene/squalene synthase family protein [bacterium]
MLSTKPAMSDRETCAALVRTHAKTFVAASRFLPNDKRRAAFAVYAFCRIADDIVDESPSASIPAARDALEGHRRSFVATVQGNPNGPYFRELAWAMQHFRISPTPFHALINTLHGDLTPGEIATWDALSNYCRGVASTVGVMCAHVFGLPADAGERDDALRHARTLGIALQLTNILRDVGEDAARGRCYLPTADLAAFGIARHEVLDRTIDARDERWRGLMRHEITRARGLYSDAAPGIRMLSPDAQCCALICSRGYAAILGAIERRDLDSLRGRARVSASRKAIIILDAWRASRVAARPALASRSHFAPGSLRGLGNP